jgi:hypothetical protein
MNAPLTLREKVLYHQIHPAKAATDILSGVVSLWLVWRREWILGFAVHFIPPIVASIVMVRFVDLSMLKASQFGQYVARSMTRPVELARLFGDGVMVAGALLRNGWAIALGAVVVLGAWSMGLARRPAMNRNP